MRQILVQTVDVIRVTQLFAGEEELRFIFVCLWWTVTCNELALAEQPVMKPCCDTQLLCPAVEADRFGPILASVASLWGIDCFLQPTTATPGS